MGDQLQKSGVSKVGKRMGASGGAASAILTMAESDLFLKLYQVYQLYYEGRFDRTMMEAFRDTGLTPAVYAEAVRDTAVFERAQSNALIVSKCSSSENTIFHGFQNREQLLAAGYSSGDASLFGSIFGTVVDGTSTLEVGHCGDGGTPSVFPSAVASVNFAVLLYNTPWISVSQPTSESIDTLFRAGVDNAVATLQSPDLAASAGGGDMLAVTPGPNKIVTTDEFSPIAWKLWSPSDTRDVDLAAKHMTVDAEGNSSIFAKEALVL